MPKRPPAEFESAFAAPAKALEEGIELAERGARALLSKAPLRRAEEYWETLGPGLTTGASDNDPSGIATYSQAAAGYGAGLVWMTLFTLPFMATVQEMCARIGLVSGKGLAANIRQHYSLKALYAATALLLAANVLNIAADLGAMAAGARLLLPTLPAGLLVVLFALVSLALQVFTTYARYAKYLKYLALTLFSYVLVAVVVPLDWGNLLAHLVIPSFSFTRGELFIAAAVLGTTISPYLFFWQTSQEVEEEVLRGETTLASRRREASPEAVRKMRIDVWSGMSFSNFISFFIFAAVAGTLYAHGVRTVATAAQAALALQPFGEAAYLLFALGIIGTGLLAVPVLAGSTAYAIAESAGWKYGLYRKLKQAYAFYGVIILSMLAGVAANFMHLDPIKGLIWAAVANGVVAPVILFFVIRLSSNGSVMGPYANGRLAASVGWLTVVIMALSGIAALATLVL